MADNRSKVLTCGHCGNISAMKIIGTVDATEIHHTQEGYSSESGDIYNVLSCPACLKINITSYFWHDGFEGEDDVTYKILYPIDNGLPLGLPEFIASSMRAAEKIKNIDVNAYVILLRRTLEQVCLDRKASGGTLANMLRDLADKREIPEKLVKVAQGLKDFGNIGAHAGIGELSEKEIPIVRALTFAILEYIYTAPYLASLAESKLTSIKGTKKGTVK